MKCFLLFLCIIIGCPTIYAQEFDIEVIDSLYREDQFYAAVTYNLLSKVPKSLSQNGFSGGYHLGFIRDMPINKKRNIALGVGLGISLNSYNQNILIEKDGSGNIDYTILEDNSTYSKNKFSVNLIEVPFEFRWRTSTQTEYKFWRIYSGFKFGYVISHTTKHEGDIGKIKYTDINDFNNIQYGLTLSVGYNTWNIHCYYGLNSIFTSNAQLDNNALDMNVIKIGLMFYIL